MEPRIQHAQTKDGVSIAFWTLGEGTPFVEMPTIPMSHIQMEWQIPEVRRWYERLSEKRKLVRYDGRGSGLSDRDVTDYSLSARSPIMGLAQEVQSAYPRNDGRGTRTRLAIPG